MAKQLWAPWRLEYIAQADEQPGCVFCDAVAGDDEERPSFSAASARSCC